MPLPESPHMLACHQKHKHIECRDGDKQLSKHLQDPCSLETNNNQTNKSSHRPLPEGPDGLLVIGLLLPRCIYDFEDNLTCHFQQPLAANQPLSHSLSPPLPVFGLNVQQGLSNKEDSPKSGIIHFLSDSCIRKVILKLRGTYNIT